ncbi:MAG: FAD:protein FMN transferase [Bacteroidaceae bacterium]|nr:FAD:protein FMN transferase [Bacteroidaceae bacterium]
MNKNILLRIAKVAFLLFLMIGTALIIRNNRDKVKQSQTEWTTNEGKVFGTTYHITYHSAQDMHDSILVALAQVDSSLSMFNPESQVAKINSNETDVMNPQLKHLLAQSLEISQKTDGSFDVTVAPLVNAWGFGFKNAESVSQTQIDSIMQFVGYDKVHINGDKLEKKDPRTMLDFSAIAKGYGVDQVAAVLERNGITDYMVEIGGEMRLSGKNKEKKDWSIGVQNPHKDGTHTENNLQMIVSVSNCGIATSGNYNRYYIKDGQKISHTIDPSTGRPVTHNLLSATVRAKDCATADALATSFMVMGKEKAMQFLKAHKEYSAILIYAKEDGTLASEQFGAWIVK